MLVDYYSTVLDDKKHDRTGFSCGVPELDHYFRDRAIKDYRSRVAVPHILVETATERILGYYTLSMRSINRDCLPRSIARRLPYRQIPVALIGRLAVHQDFQNKGWGWRLLADAFARVSEASKEVATCAIIVEAKNEAVASFYKHVGFQPMADNPLMLFIPMESLSLRGTT